VLQRENGSYRGKCQKNPVRWRNLDI
jgi:hypothetical protein